MWKLPFFLREKTNCQSFLVLILQAIRLTSDLQHATVKMTLFRDVTWIVLRKTLTVTIKMDWLGKKVVNQKNFFIFHHTLLLCQNETPPMGEVLVLIIVAHNI